ncbi:MAG: hypothetical protein ACR2FK_04775 [Sphingomicrobium sp.]
MSQWSFVIAAYAIVGMATLGLIAWAMTAMRRAETEAEAVKRRP